ncbi:MAG: RHS repeat-associated core domain-containing protein, partial [Bacteroidetes bacterium]|nr:RHS repeat-associated core domain-containing protein [Bacteroidota bacterium]
MSGDRYRFGFNGKESDDEWNRDGNMYNYGFRIHDPRLGRFLNVDPLAPIYPELTPFQYASNSPIAMIDIDGLEG